MEPHVQLSALLDLAEELGLTVRSMPAAAEDSDHPGGAVVRLKGRPVLFLNSQAPLADRLEVVARALAARKELDQRFVPPEIRQLLERCK